MSPYGNRHWCNHAPSAQEIHDFSQRLEQDYPAYGKTSQINMEGSVSHNAAALLST